MQRKTKGNTSEKDTLMAYLPGQSIGPLPFQTKGRAWGKSPMSNGFVLDAIKCSFPIFGGTSTETTTENKPEEKTETTTETGGGEEKIELTPEKIQELQSQLADTVAKNADLSKQLSGFTNEKETARKAALGREEALTEDLGKAQETIDAQDQVIKSLALINAIQGNKEYQFHNPQDVISRLDHSAYQFDVDLDNHKAGVSGLENELKRIAGENDYLLVKPNGEISEAKPARRGTGNPPGPAPTNSTKATRRKELEAKWPVIGLGRAALG